ncbi:MAG: Transcriptional regulator, MarR family [Candidatus Methanohalarchaeum thermophilum]|uniref:Transcriptional regulator, MarR family n=1 Tax=Methanohalarchaeum thermophilum TaxID=1903181 RepID=A0A1Q6DW89_METT1|nr:MAG: Transcriptional regulator, MarR family [Candidatus Methanohalarchaeum thermophilum]
MLLILEGNNCFKKIIKESNYSKKSVSNVIKKFKDEGLIKYHVNEDKRIKEYELTEKGLRELKIYNRKLNQKIENLEDKHELINNRSFDDKSDRKMKI